MASEFLQAALPWLAIGMVVAVAMVHSVAAKK